MRLRVGLVGLGDAWENRHRPALHALSDRFEVRGVCEPVAHRAEAAASEFGSAAMDGYQVLVRREDIDAILILSAGWYGSLPIAAACDAHKAVYLGSGLDVSAAEARSVKRRVAEAGIPLMAEFPYRQSPATLRLKELIATSLGPPRLLFCHQRLALRSRSCRGAGRREQSAMRRELAELVDWCCYVVGRNPRCVTGITWHRAGDGRGEDYQMMSLDFSPGDKPSRGPVAQISCGRYIPAAWSEAVTYRPLAAMQISCERGIAFVDLPATLIWFDEAGRHQEPLQSERPVGEQSLRQFHRAVANSPSNVCGLEDVCRALYFVEQAAKSHRKGRRIEL